MSANVFKLPTSREAERSRIQDEALHWIMEVDRGLTEERKNDLSAWFSTSPVHIEVFLENAKLWDDLDVMSTLADIIPYEGIEQKRKRPGYYLIAASFLLVAMLATIVANVFSDGSVVVPQSPVYAAQQAVFETPRGEINTFTLSDGSKLTLNTHSKVEVAYNQAFRNIHLVYGELYIDVAHNKERPLNIVVEDKRFQAVGTAFSVMYTDSQEVELTVSDGRVLLTNNVSESDAPRISTVVADNETGVILTAGQKTSVSVNSNPDFRALNIQDISDSLQFELSWRTGSLTFSGQSMADAIAEVNRFLDKPILLADDDVRALKVIGRYEHGNLTQFVRALEQNFNLHAETDERGQITLRLQKPGASL